MKYFKTYKDYLNEQVVNESAGFINESSDEQEALKNLKGSDRPRLHQFKNGVKSDINVYEPKEKEDEGNIDMYLVFNPETKHFVTIKAFNDYFKKIEAGEITEAADKKSVKKVTVPLKKAKAAIDDLKSDIKTKKPTTNKSNISSEKINTDTIKRTNNHYKNGFVKGAAPGNAGSMLNENISNESASHLFGKKIKESDAVLSMYKKLKGGELLNQQSSGLPKEISTGEIKKIKAENKNLANIPDNQLARIVLAVRGGNAKRLSGEESAKLLKWPIDNCTFQGYFGDKDGLDAQKQIAKNAKKILAPDGTELTYEEVEHFINISGKSHNPADTAQFLTNKKTGDVVIFFTSDKDSVGAIVANTSFSAEGSSKIEKNKELVKNKLISQADSTKADAIINKHVKTLQKIESELKVVAGIPAAALLKMNNAKVLAELKSLGLKHKTSATKYYDIIMKDIKPTKEPGFDKMTKEEKAKSKERSEAAAAKYNKSAPADKLKLFLNKAKNETETLTSEEQKIITKLKDSFGISDEESNRAIEKIRKRSIEVEMKLKKELNDSIKLKVGGKSVGLGDYHDATNIIDKMHLAGALGKKEGVFKYTGLFKVVCGGPVITDEILQTCLGTKDMNEFIQKFGSEPDQYQKSGEGNITGSARIVYFQNSKGGKMKIAEKRQRSTSGETGKFSATYKWSEDLQKCFKLKGNTKINDTLESNVKLSKTLNESRFNSYRHFLNEKNNNIK